MSESFSVSKLSFISDLNLLESDVKISKSSKVKKLQGHTLLATGGQILPTPYSFWYVFPLDSKFPCVDTLK